MTSSNASGDATMEGKTPVLLLKTRSVPNDGYAEYFSSSDRACDPIFVPVLEHRLEDTGMEIVRVLVREKKIGKDGKYGGLIFTSQRAVEAFAKIVAEGPEQNDAEPQKWPYLQSIPIYTVGPATSRALRAIPQTPPMQIFGGETSNGEVLAGYILEHYNAFYASASSKPPLLFLVGETRRDIIPKTLMDPQLLVSKRIQVDELVVYGTGVMESFERDFEGVLRETAEQPIRWVVIFSPTGCEAMLQALGMLDRDGGKTTKGERGGGYGLGKGRRTYIATIGPTTRDFLRKNFGFEPDVCAEKPSPEGVGEGIAKFMAEVGKMDKRTSCNDLNAGIDLHYTIF